MKKDILFCVIATLLITLVYTCKKDGDGESLPPYTEIGANTFTFRVNGKVYESEVGYFPTSPRISIVYNHIDTFLNNNCLFTIEGNKILLEDNKTVHINIHYMPNTGRYYLNEYMPMGQGNYAYYWDNKPVELSYYTDNSHTGELNITRLDTINHIIAGKFKFNAKRYCFDRECSEVVFIDGQFDVTYKPNEGVNY